MGDNDKKDSTIKLNPVILFTSCVKPGKMYKTAITDSEERFLQYCASLDYLLENTELKIVVVDNTNTDYSKNFNDHRLEILYFDGNHFDKNLGKGYGEVEIMKYAFMHSRFINKANYIIKITGRTPLVNIEKYLKWYRLNVSTALLDIRFNKRYRFCLSRVIFAPKYFYENYFFDGVEKINDSRGYCFENHLYESASKALIEKQLKIRLVIFPFVFNGVSGTNGSVLKTTFKCILKTFIGNIILNLRILCRGYIHT